MKTNDGAAEGSGSGSGGGGRDEDEENQVSAMDIAKGALPIAYRDAKTNGVQAEEETENAMSSTAPDASTLILNKDLSARMEDATAAATENGTSAGENAGGDEKEEKYRVPKFTVIEALSATGLRSIRYAKELDDVG